MKTKRWFLKHILMLLLTYMFMVSAGLEFLQVKVSTFFCFPFFIVVVVVYFLFVFFLCICWFSSVVVSLLLLLLCRGLPLRSNVFGRRQLRNLHLFGENFCLPSKFFGLPLFHLRWGQEKSEARKEGSFGKTKFEYPWRWQFVWILFYFLLIFDFSHMRYSRPLWVIYYLQ